LRVLGIDRYAPPHDRGSSHGDSRIIREAYFEDPVYVPLVRRAYELWRDLERASGTHLLQETGGLMIGAPDSVLVEGALTSARLHGLPHEVLDADAIRARFPAFTPERGMVGVFETRAGVLRPEACIAAHLAQARALGATLRLNEPVRGWEADGDGVRVHTEHGEARARQLVLCAGAWVNDLLPGSALPVSVERQVLHWFRPVRDRADFAPARCPIHLWQFDGDRFFYGFPDLGAGVKAAFHHGGVATAADTVERAVADDEVESVRAAMRRFLPAADGPLVRSVTCLYTNTPDEHFWIDRHPAHPQALVVSACSGHGFKFAPAIGEIVADLLAGSRPHFDLGAFRAR
jgi:sarcosine oxidase